MFYMGTESPFHAIVFGENAARSLNLAWLSVAASNLFTFGVVAS